jgi:ligand-binding sensor domain-containing protein
LERNYTGKQANSLFVDREGALWVASEDTLLFLPRGQKSFHETGERLHFAAQLAQAPNGIMWLGELSIRPMSVDGEGAAVPGPEIELETVRNLSRRRFSSEGILFDHDGSLWVANEDHGVLRIRFPERLPGHGATPSGMGMETFSPKDGLTGSARAILQDREGNIWVGTAGGLDRFRQNKLVQVAWPSSSYGFALVPGDKGSVWAGTPE